MRNRIGLLDVDGHNFPNLVQMKLSAWHKRNGDDVERFFPFNEYDVVYKSKVFTFTNDYETAIRAGEIVEGGTGYFYPDGGRKLPKEIEHIYPDYSLYGVMEAYGFMTRGCPRGCHFCIVAKKEGQKSCKVADLGEFWNGQSEIKLLDPNLLAAPESEELLQQLVDSNAWVDFTQGVDIRLMTDKSAEMFSRMKLKMIHFAWDNYEFSTYEKLKEFRTKLNFDGRKLRVYVLTNFNTTHEQDLERIYKLKELDYDPYLMIFDKQELPRGHETLRMQRWVNNKFIFRSCERFEDYK